MAAVGADPTAKRAILAAIVETLPRLGAGDPVCVGALVVLEREDGAEVRYLVLPCAGGRRVVHGGSTVTAVSPGSPLGRSLLGKGIDDEVIARTPRGLTALVVVDLA